MGIINDKIKAMAESDKTVKEKYFEITAYLGYVARNSMGHRVAAQEAMWEYFMKKYLDKKIMLAEEV